MILLTVCENLTLPLRCVVLHLSMSSKVHAWDNVKNSEREREKERAKEREGNALGICSFVVFNVSYANLCGWPGGSGVPRSSSTGQA